MIVDIILLGVLVWGIIALIDVASFISKLLVIGHPWGIPMAVIFIISMVIWWKW